MHELKVDVAEVEAVARRNRHHSALPRGSERNVAVPVPRALLSFRNNSPLYRACLYSLSSDILSSPDRVLGRAMAPRTLPGDGQLQHIPATQNASYGPIGVTKPYAMQHSGHLDINQKNRRPATMNHGLQTREYNYSQNGGQDMNASMQSNSSTAGIGVSTGSCFHL
jgi:hypothetical protein